jgi:hypothetical protein
MIHSLKTSGDIMKIAVSHNKELFWSVRDLCVQHGMNIQGKFPQKEEPNKSKIPGVVVVEEKK